MFRFKTIIGANLKSRSLANQKTEASVAGLCAYVASKHAVLGLTRTAAVEWGPRACG